MRPSSRALRDKLALPLPGLAAQQQMAPVGRIPRVYDPSPAGARDSAVLILITPGEELVFIRRAQDGRTHGGQIAFPGGEREPEDSTLVDTALRETEEEIGVSRLTVTTLGLLTRLFIPVSNFSVQPVVAELGKVPPFVFQADEVDDVVVLPMSGFSSATSSYVFSHAGSDHRAPCYQFGDIIVWGATAMITAELLAVWDGDDEGGGAPRR